MAKDQGLSSKMVLHLIQYARQYMTQHALLQPSDMPHTNKHFKG